MKENSEKIIAAMPSFFEVMKGTLLVSWNGIKTAGKEIWQKMPFNSSQDVNETKIDTHQFLNRQILHRKAQRVPHIQAVNTFLDTEGIDLEDEQLQKFIKQIETNEPKVNRSLVQMVENATVDLIHEDEIKTAFEEAEQRSIARLQNKKEITKDDLDALHKKVLYDRVGSNAHYLFGVFKSMAVPNGYEDTHLQVECEAYQNKI